MKIKGRGCTKSYGEDFTVTFAFTPTLIRAGFEGCYGHNDHLPFTYMDLRRVFHA